MKKLLVINLLVSIPSLYACGNNSILGNQAYSTNNKVDDNQIINAELINITNTDSDLILGKYININYGSYPKEDKNAKYCTMSINISTKIISPNLYKFNEAYKGSYCELKNPEPNGPIGYGFNSSEDKLSKEEAIKIIKSLKINKNNQKDIINKAIEILTNEEVKINDNLKIIN